MAPSALGFNLPASAGPGNQSSGVPRTPGPAGAGALLVRTEQYRGELEATPAKPACSDETTPYVYVGPASHMVSESLGLFVGHRVSDRRLGVTLLGDEVTRSFRKSAELGFGRPAAETRDHAQVEGPTFRVFVGPGVVEARRHDPVRAHRTRERQTAAMIAAGIAGQLGQPTKTRGSVSSWSRKSVSNMTRVMHGLDWSEWESRPGRPALVTLTAASRWLAQFPCAEAGSRAIKLLLLQFTKDWGYRPAGMWKREFQDRQANCRSCRKRRYGVKGGHEHPDSGRAPHWHLLIRVPDPGQVLKDGTDFRTWLARAWVKITCAGTDLTEAERADMYAVHAHEKTVAYPKGKWTVSGIVSYFTKHGTFSAKSYQNVPPAEWVDKGSVGRYWGRWMMERKVGAVEISGDDYDVVRRTMRRWSRANSQLVDVPMWRYRTRVDPDTGVITADWRKSRKRRRLYQMRGPAGYLVVPDGPALASNLARAADRARERHPGREWVSVGPPPGALSMC